MNHTSEVWQDKLQHCLLSPDYIVKPRGLEVREVLNGRYIVPMPAYLNLLDRKINLAFMFSEAAFILEGSNLLSKIKPYMKGYAQFSDDGIFMRGSYGPPVIEQLPYIIDTIASDIDTRQAILTIWRPRPGHSADIPCTVALQFLIRENKLHTIATMRSNDIVLGATYDVFVFSMISYTVMLLLKLRGVEVTLGDLHVNAGSLHLYETHYKQAQTWIDAEEVDSNISERVNQVLGRASIYEELIDSLWQGANDARLY